MDYDTLYKTSSVWGPKPNEFLAQIAPLVKEKGEFLDLGCGQGRDSLFMWQQGFEVTAVDNSKEGIENIDKRSEGKIKAICQNIEDYEIAPKKYSVINAWNVFQFVKKDDALSIIRSMQNGTIDNGFIIISGFTVDDLAFQKPLNKNRGFFKKDELKELFHDFKIIRYDERLIDDPGHPGSEQPHKHGVVKLIAQKVGGVSCP